MSVVSTAHDSEKHPEKYRIDPKDAARVLKPNPTFEVNEKLPIIHSESDIAIIGAGFSGLTSAVMCRRKLKTDNFVVFEKHNNWGGTWWANTYPGCASDIPALWYSLHSDLNSNWSDLRPPQYEMEEYILTVVKKYNLAERTRFETAVSQAKWDEARGVWVIDALNVKSGQRYQHTAKVVMQCQGGLVYPNDTNFPGLKDKYKGTYMHSALYDHSVDLKGKDVIVIGNGCSAAQVVPALMDEIDAKSVTQIFRSKHWISPPLPAFLYTMYRWLSGFRLGLLFIRWMIILGAESRYPLYQGNSLLSRVVRWINTKLSTHYIHSTAPKKYQEMLIPDYKLGCKRLIFDYKYVPSLNNPKFDLTDSPIKEVTEHHVILEDGRKLKADAIVACTGYNVSRSFYGMKIIGRNNYDVNETWKKEGVTAYKTVMVRDCPNYFFIAGPNSATGHFSVVSACENAVAFAARYVPDIVGGKLKSVTVKESAYYRWFERTQQQLKSAVFGTEFGGCVSWYTENGVNSTAYPYSQLYYWIASRYLGSEDLELVRESKKQV